MQKTTEEGKTELWGGKRPPHNPPEKHKDKSKKCKGQRTNRGRKSVFLVKSIWIPDWRFREWRM